MNKFKNLKIKTKIYSLAGFLILLSLVIMGLSKLQSDANEEIIRANKIDYYMLQARRAEKNFFDRKNLQYADEVKKIYQNILKTTSKYKGNSNYDKIADAAKVYYKNFQKSVQLEKEIGLDENHGLQDKLRNNVHAVEAIAQNVRKDNIMVQMLMARRHEKDFMLRGKKKYIDELHQAVDKMTNAINTSNIPNSQKLIINALVKSYRESFDNYAGKFNEITASTENLKAAVHKIGPLVSQLEKVAQSDSSFWQTTALTIAFISILIGIFLSYIITKLITAPIQNLTESAEAFANGDTNVKIEASSNDEIGTLSNVMNKMVEQIGLQISYLDNLPTPVIIIDKEYNVQYINKFGIDLVGKSKEVCHSSKCSDLLNTDHCHTEECRLHQAMNDRKVHEAEQVARPNGKEIDILYTGTPIIDKNGELLGAMEFVADISNVKEAEKYLDRSTTTIMAAMERFAQGDLTVQIKPEKTGDDIAKLFVAFNDTVQNIKNIINQVIDAVEATASASTQISSSAEEMAAGAQEQSSQTGEIATAMEEMSSTILETNQNTSVAAEAAKDSGTLAEEGGGAVTATIKGMEKIAEVVLGAADTVKVLGEQSEKIGEIIHVINDIADQTNLLALNAAIEAARAGEQGRGFAVVADEVRKLAERTTTATKEIAGMINQLQTGTTETVNSIEQGVEEVNNGKELAAKAGESINEIVKSSSRVMDVITQVATASEEQSATAEEISKNIESINLVAQESAAGVEQIAKASEDLNRLTDGLQNLVQQFKINVDGNEQLSRF